MPTKPKLALKAWSFSRYRLDKTCGFKLELTAIRGLKEPGNKYMERGNEIHSSADFYVRGLIADLPPALENFTEEFVRLRKGFAKKKVHCELEYNYYRDWTPATDKFDRSIWYRGRADARELLAKKRVRIIDYKTGKPGDLDQDQLELYVVGELCANPTAELITAELWYLDLGEIVQIAVGTDGWVTRGEAEQLRAKWTKVGETMTAPGRTFLPRPHDGCRWCHFRKDNNGPCKY